jgi:hypothetical protein
MNEYVHPDKSYIVLVGDATAIKDKVEVAGKVNTFDIAGEELSMASLAVEAVSYEYDTAAIKDMKATYSLNAQGMAIGDLNVEIARKDDVIQVSSSVAGMISMEENMSFKAADLAPVSYKMTFEAMGQGMEAEYVFTETS